MKAKSQGSIRYIYLASPTMPTYRWQLSGGAVCQRVGRSGGNIVAIDAAIAGTIATIAIDAWRKVLLRCVFGQI